MPSPLIFLGKSRIPNWAISYPSDVKGMEEIEAEFRGFSRWIASAVSSS